MADRTPRENTTREAAEHPTFWQPPNLLPDPNPKEGVVYRWIRISTLGNADTPNVSTRFREGWEPVPAGDVPELQIIPDKTAKFPGNVEVGGLLLCRNSVENSDARRKYYENMAESQVSAANNALMRESDPRMPLRNDSSTSVSFGSGRPR